MVAEITASVKERFSALALAQSGWFGWCGLLHSGHIRVLHQMHANPFFFVGGLVPISFSRRNPCSSTQDRLLQYKRRAAGTLASSRNLSKRFASAIVSGATCGVVRGSGRTRALTESKRRTPSKRTMDVQPAACIGHFKPPSSNMLALSFRAILTQSTMQETQIR